MGGVKDEKNFNIMRVNRKIRFLEESSWKYIWEIAEKEWGAWTVCRFKGGLGKKKRGPKNISSNSGIALMKKPH